MAAPTPTLAEVLVLPYGDGGGQTLTDLGALNGLAYTGGPAFSNGMTGESRRGYHREHGERVQWLRALESTSADANAQGRIFVPQLFDDDVRVLIYQNEVTTQGEDFGLIRVGQTRLSWMPDEISPTIGDHFLALDRATLPGQSQRAVLSPKSDVTRALPHRYVATIVAVYENEVAMPASRYVLTPDYQLRWTGTVPTGAVVVLYQDIPAYELLGEDWKTGPLGSDGLRLPSTAPLKLLGAGEE